MKICHHLLTIMFSKPEGLSFLRGTQKEKIGKSCDKKKCICFRLMLVLVSSTVGFRKLGICCISFLNLAVEEHLRLLQISFLHTVYISKLGA
ncbi:hypothetical protein PO909_032233 [Leuciscus waleckii]